MELQTKSQVLIASMVLILALSTNSDSHTFYSESTISILLSVSDICNHVLEN